MMRVLGLDPGLQTTGYAVLDGTPAGPTIAEAGVFRSAPPGRAVTDMAPRLVALYDAVNEVLDQHKPDAIAVEQLFAHYDHPRTAVLMAHARGCFFLAGGRRNIPLVSYAPARVKKTITGSGRATKEQMQHAVMRELRVAKLPEPHDVADALAIALCHYHLTGGPVPGRTSKGVNLSNLLADADALT